MTPSPDVLFGELFRNVQRDPSIFKDSMEFADAVPLSNPTLIMAAYHKQKNGPDFNLEDFVRQHFLIRATTASSLPRAKKKKGLTEVLETMWGKLTRCTPKDEGSLIGLPYCYIAPGGRFSAMYYWDTYFAMLGLQDGEMIANLIRNFAFLIDKYGFIPNANRSYYLGRSQPPFFHRMLDFLPPQDRAEHHPRLARELAYWLKPGEHGIPIEGTILSRYYDTQHGQGPRPESFREDEMAAKKYGTSVYLHLRAACESGWDFSSRWYSSSSSEIITSDLLPVDLNALLLEKKRTLKRLTPAEERVFGKLFWDADKGWFFDYNYKTKKIRNTHWTLAGMFPLYCRLATQEQAHRVADNLQRKFLRAGGLVTSLNHTLEQWDAPNGWAPLQWVGIVGLRYYGFHRLADLIKRRWIRTNTAVFEKVGCFMEKYNVENPNVLAGGGEYALVTDGFAWTNGVLSALLHDVDCREF